jgi:formylglycine-generating enzyme required for sulfatase activity
VARVPAPRKGKFTNSLGMEFALVPKGKSWLGGGGGKVGTQEVVIPADFYLGTYAVTQKEWQQVMGNNPSTYKAGHKDVAEIPPDELEHFPVETVTWEDAQQFVAKVNALDRQAGWEYRLPTEVEWEYACRGGPLDDPADSAYDYYLSTPLNQLLPEQANFKHEKGLNRPCKVGSYPPNRLGLYDMHGNVWQWCLDEAPPDPKDPKGAAQRVLRGGCWHGDSRDCRAANRFAYLSSGRNSNHGLRLARVPVGAGVK